MDFVGFKRHRGRGGVGSGNQLLGLLFPAIRSVECLQKKKMEKVLDRKMATRGRSLFLLSQCDFESMRLTDEVKKIPVSAHRCFDIRSVCLHISKESFVFLNGHNSTVLVMINAYYVQIH